jgi:hypothetical protein
MQFIVHSVENAGSLYDVYFQSIVLNSNPLEYTVLLKHEYRMYLFKHGDTVSLIMSFQASTTMGTFPAYEEYCIL